MLASFVKSCPSISASGSFARSAAILLTKRRKMEAGRVSEASDPNY
jgi:hypothetical protein